MPVKQSPRVRPAPAAREALHTPSAEKTPKWLYALKRLLTGRRNPARPAFRRPRGCTQISVRELDSAKWLRGDNKELKRLPCPVPQEIE